MSTPAKNPLTPRLTPGADDLLRSIRASGFPGWSAMEVEQARAAILQMKLFAGPQEPVGRVEQIQIAGRDGSDIPAQLYIPDSSEPVPTMVYMHGGGWVIGNHTSVDELVRTLVNRSGCAALSVDYRRSLQVAASPCWEPVLPDVISAILSSDAWSSSPAVPPSALACFFPGVIGLP